MPISSFIWPKKLSCGASLRIIELVWKIAKVDFVDVGKPAGSERTGGVRYPKKLNYSVNIDIIHCVITSNESAYKCVLLSWTGFEIDFDIEWEKILARLFSALSEGAVFKMTDGNRDVIFNQKG